MRLLEFDIKYIHIPGRENVLADRMSWMQWIGNEGGEEIGAASSLEAAAVDTQELAELWKDWLEDRWYGGVVYYKLFGHLEDYYDQDGKQLSAH